VLVFGPVTDPASLARLGRRWSRLVQVSHDPSLDPVRAGLEAGGVLLIRPDGHIGFRSPSTGAAALTALDGHLRSYLIPDQTADPLGEATADFVDEAPPSRPLPETPAET
jgi:hypothetical protein